MDGNRRYGRAKHGDPLKARLTGHSDGGKVLGDFLGWCMELGVEMVTVFAFSTENWRRSPPEVELLMDILCQYCQEFTENATERNARIHVLASDEQQLPDRVRDAIRLAEEGTRHCTGFVLNVCLSYGARQEIVQACRRVASAAVSGAIGVADIDEAVFARQLLTAGIPDPDVLIRTSGECRISNFLLYQLAYTEMFFVPKLWPEFTKKDFLDIVGDYHRRERRYGG
ncbi:unnamed protein product [Phaeothamnion confervicola]